MLITVFTPTYNRGYIIGKLYESLKKQSFRDFEWLIIDDGSTDNTESLIESFKRNNDFFPIRYVKTENGGKHRAINIGVKIAKGSLFFIVDSDDYLPEDSLEIVSQVESTMDNTEKDLFAGLCGLKSLSSGQVVGRSLDCDYCDETTIELKKKGVFGDKAEVFYTHVLEQNPFPEFDGEKFCTESIVWDRIAQRGLRMRYFNKSIYSCDYLEDGLTHQGYQLYANNPKQWGLSINQDYEFGKTNRYGQSLEIYKYFLYEKSKLSIKDMANNLQISLFSVCLFVSFHYLLDVIRRFFGKNTIKATIRDNTDKIV